MTAPLEVLLVEDNLADVVLMQTAFQRIAPQVQLRVARDGTEALRYVRREAEHADAPRPDLVLLDLNLPIMDGFAVLHALQDDHDLRTLPVVVLSTSDADQDVTRAYTLGVNAYLVKPRDLTGLFERVRLIEQFWLTVVRLPTRAASW